MRDGLLRRAIKKVALVCYMTDLKITRGLGRLRGEPGYELGGECRLCAKCCEAPSVQLHPICFRLRSLRRLFILWHKHVNGFELVDIEPRQCVLVFRCTHFDWETRRCDSYGSRPGMCRDYPRNLLYQGSPEFLPGCGYCALNRKRDKVAAMLAGMDIPEEKRARIDEVFRLKEREKDVAAGEGEKTSGEG